MRAGRLDRRARFEARTAVSDGYGNEVGAWGERLTVWAELRPERAGERLEAGRPESRTRGVLRFRDSAAARQVTAADRAMIDGDAWRLMGEPVAVGGARSGVLEVLVERV